MGIMRNILAARKLIKEAEAEAKKYKEMTEEEFYALGDDEFYEGVTFLFYREIGRLCRAVATSAL